MTTPGGVPNLPVGALTLDTLESKLQDMSATAMKNRAVERFPGIMDNSTGLSPALEFSPFGILVRLFAGANSAIANADPNDIQGPEDLPPLMLDFIESLPVVGQFVELFEAIIGGYDGEDEILRAISQLFAPIRALVQLVPGINALLAFVGIGTGTDSNTNAGNNPLDALNGLINKSLTDLGSLFQQIFGQQATGQAQINNLGSGGFTHDFAINGVAGWTSLAGAFVLSSRGKFVQAATETVGYRASNVAAEKFGLHFVVDPSMRGVTRGGICAPSDGSSGIDLEVFRGFDGDAVRLVTRGSPTLTVIQRQADFIGTNRIGDLTNFDLRTDGVNKFTVLRNGQPVPALDFTDTAGLVTHDSTTRGVLLTSNGDDRDDDGFWGPALTGKAITYGTW